MPVSQRRNNRGVNFRGIRTIWFEVPRGRINNFGNFRYYLKEGEVSIYEEFEALWKDYYPKESQWYSFTTSTYEEKKYFFLNSKLIFTYDKRFGRSCIPHLASARSAKPSSRSRRLIFGKTIHFQILHRTFVHR